MIEFHTAETAEAREAVQRFRYDVYVEEMGRYRSRADHVHRCLADEEDERSWIVYATDGGRVVASTRVTWGGAGFSRRQIEQYQLDPFLAEIPVEHLAVGERTMIAPAWRGTDLFLPLTDQLQQISASHDVRVVFGACEPHLISFYANYQRPYGTRNINTSEAGFLVPLVAFPEGTESLLEFGVNGALPRCVEAVVTESGTVTGPLFTSDTEYHHLVTSRLAALGSSVFDGLDDTQLAACVARSNVVTCQPGDRLLKAGGAARNIFVVLDGHLEVSRDRHVVGSVHPGEIVGEMAYFSGGSRQFDVDVVETNTRLLSLSERTLHNLAAEHPGAAAGFFTNLSRQLSTRLALIG
jgi:hypothetical protein